MRPVEREYLSSYRIFFMKNCYPTQNFTEIGQSAAELWPKNDFKDHSYRKSRFMYVFRRQTNVRTNGQRDGQTHCVKQLSYRERRLNK